MVSFHIQFSILIENTFHKNKFFFAFQSLNMRFDLNFEHHFENTLHEQVWRDRSNQVFAVIVVEWCMDSWCYDQFLRRFGVVQVPLMYLRCAVSSTPWGFMKLFIFNSVEMAILQYNNFLATNCVWIFTEASKYVVEPPTGVAPFWNVTFILVPAKLINIFFFCYIAEKIASHFTFIMLRKFGWVVKV